MISIWGFSVDIELVVFYGFTFFALIQFIYIILIFGRFVIYKPQIPKGKVKNLPVSVVICAKNEYENLKENLPLILNQKYKDFELVVVNDFSDDESVHLLRKLEKKHTNLKIVTLRENVNFFAGKKLALAVGIKSAKHDLVLLTDADCKPTSLNWISEMQKNFVNGKDIVLGYGGYYKYPGLLNALIRFDTISIALQYFAFALAGRPYMGVGRNLAYRKALFVKAKGFTSHYHIKSGDDDIFINQTANKQNTCIEVSKDSFTYSEPKKSFKSWFIQKKRHLSTAKYYKATNKFMLLTYSMSQYLFFACFVVLTILSAFNAFFIIGSSVFFVRWMLLLLLYYYACQKFNESKLFIYSPLFEIIFLVLNPVFIISNLFFKRNKWK